MVAYWEARSQIESHSTTTTVVDGDAIRATAIESKSVDRYIDIVMQAIKKLEIKGAEVTEPDNSLMDTTTKAGSRCKAMLPLNNQQRERIDRVWDREKWSTPTLSAATKRRFKIAEADYRKYLKWVAFPVRRTTYCYIVFISCLVLWQADIIVGDISEQITPVWDFICGYDTCIGLTLKGQWFYYGNDYNTLTVEAASNSK